MMRRLVLASALAVLALTGSAVHAADAAPALAASAASSAPAAAGALPAATAPAAAAAPLGSASAGNLMQTTFALIFVLGLLAMLAWALKRYGPKASGGNAQVQLVGHLNLGGRERIIVVEVGDQWIVVGASPGRVNALATMPKQALADNSASLLPQRTGAGSFGDWLKQTLEQRNAK